MLQEKQLAFCLPFTIALGILFVFDLRLWFGLYVWELP